MLVPLGALDLKCTELSEGTLLTLGLSWRCPIKFHRTSNVKGCLLRYFDDYHTKQAFKTKGDIAVSFPGCNGSIWLIISQLVLPCIMHQCAAQLIDVYCNITADGRRLLSVYAWKWIIHFQYACCQPAVIWPENISRASSLRMTTCPYYSCYIFTSQAYYLRPELVLCYRGIWRIFRGIGNKLSHQQPHIGQNEVQLRPFIARFIIANIL